MPDKKSAREELTALLNKLEEHYGIKPLIYATEKSYDLYLSGYYQKCDIWIGSVIKTPKPLKNQNWTFWQYTNKAWLKGI